MIAPSPFVPAPWLRGPHRQTLFASKLRPTPPLEVAGERVDLPDGDFLDLAWLPEQGAGADAPLVVVLHGLTGSIKSKYARGLLREIAARGWRGVLMHFRGASSEPNRLARSYHSGDTGDFTWLLARLRQRYPRAPLLAVGYSLGGNVLLKYLGEQGKAALVTAAVAVSVPFDLAACAAAINRGLSRAYQYHLVGNMRAEVERKFLRLEPPFPLPNLDRLRSFRQFDDAITAPLHGFSDAADYYRRASSGAYLSRIHTPTLILQAADDPFMDPAALPTRKGLAPAVRLEVSARGGHVGFVAAGPWGKPRYWLERRIPAYLDQILRRAGARDPTPA